MALGTEDFLHDNEMDFQIVLPTLGPEPRCRIGNIFGFAPLGPGPYMGRQNFDDDMLGNDRNLEPRPPRITFGDFARIQRPEFSE